MVLTIEREAAGITRGSRVLDFGCGSGRHTFDALRAAAAVVALDRSESDVAGVANMVEAMAHAGEITEQKFGPLVADALAIPFGSATFDVVVASEILEHIASDAAAIDEVARVLRPGGVVAISVPRTWPERVNWMLSREYHEIEGGHVRIYRRRRIERLITAAGFVVVSRRYRHGLHSPYWWLRCAVGVDRSDQRLVAAYHRFLVWDIERKPAITRTLDTLLNPFVGKSLVLYCKKVA